MKAPTAFYEDGAGIGVSPVVATVAAIAAILVGVIAWSSVEKPAAEARLMPPTGAPCATASPITRRPQPRLRSAVGGVVFARGGGDAWCDVEGSPKAEESEGGDTVLCQFSAPGALSVRTGHARFDFEAPVGQVASVYVSHGAPKCILAAPYWSAFSRFLTDDMHARPS